MLVKVKGKGKWIAAFAKKLRGRGRMRNKGEDQTGDAGGQVTKAGMGRSRLMKRRMLKR